MKEFEFEYSQEQLQEIAQSSITKATEQGADQVQVVIGEANSLGVEYSRAKTNNIDFTKSIDFEINVQVGQKTAGATCNSLNTNDLTQVSERAISIAKQMQDDECNGLPEKEELAIDVNQDIDIYHPSDLQIADMVRLAKEMAQTSIAYDQRINEDKSDGTSVTASETNSVIANSFGLNNFRQKSNYSLSTSVLADFDGRMESSGWYDSNVAFNDLDNHLEIAKIAAKKVIDRANTRSIKNAKVPVLFEAGVSHSIIGSFLSAINGSAIYYGTTCFKDCINKKVFSEHFSLMEKPFIKKGKKSALNDAEGVRTREKEIIKDGILTTYLFDSYYARKLKTKTTGNAGGTSNLEVKYQENKLDDIFIQMNTGFFVTGLMGGGANTVTGDYSSGAYGFWIENGEIAYAVRDATIAGNFNEMLSNIVCGGDDYLNRGGMNLGSLLINEMIVAGSN